MEYPAAPNQEELSELLGHIISGNKPAELEKYFKRYLSSATCIGDLTTQMMQNPSTAHRQLAAVLLRKKINTHWRSLAPDLQQSFKATLLDRIASEPEAIVRKSIASLTAALAANEIATWPEVLNFISECVKSEMPNAKEIGVYLISELVEDPDTCAFLTPHQQQLMTVLAAALNEASRDTRRYALKALGNLAVNSEDPKASQELVKVISPILAIVQDCLENFDEQMVAFSFEVFSNLLENEVEFGANLEPVVRMAVGVTANSQLQLSIRECASDFIETLIDVKSKMLVANPATITYLLENAFTVSVECDDNPEEPTPVDMAFRLIDTLAIALPNKTIYPILMEKASVLHKSEMPRARRSGIIAIGVGAEGCADYMKQNLDGIVQVLLSSLSDPEAIVREAGGLSLGYAAEHLKPEILEKHSEILPALLQSLDAGQTRVKQKIIYALDIFCENFDDDIEKYLDLLLPKIVGVITTEQEPKTKQMALAALSSTLSAAEQKLGVYFSQLAQVLGGILLNETDLTVKATALQCLGNLAAASTPTEFAPFLQDSVNVAVSALDSNQLELREAGFAFFYSLCRLLKENCEPYADKVVTEALKSCEVKEEVKIKFVEDEDDLSEDDSDEDEDDDKMGSKVRTAFLDEKTAALHALGHFAVALPNKVLPHMANITTNLEKLLMNDHENIRMQVVSTSQQFVESLYNQGTDEEFWLTHMLHRWIELISTDESKEVVCRVFEGLEELSKNFGVKMIPPHYMEDLIKAIEVVLQEKASCQREGDENEGDHDESLMTDLTDLIQQLSKTWGDQWSPCLEKLLPLLSKFCKDERNARDRNMFTGCLADTLCNLPTVTAKYANDFLQLAFRNLRSGDATLYRNSLYYLGAIYEVYPSFSSQLSDILGLVSPFFTGSFDLDTEDNAAACVCRMITATGDLLPLDQILPVLFSKLPLRSDLAETSTVLKATVWLYNKGVDMSNYHVVCIRTMMESLIIQSQEPDKFKLDPGLIQSVKAILNGIKADSNFVEIGTKLTSESQALLNHLLSN